MFCTLYLETITLIINVNDNELLHFVNHMQLVVFFCRGRGKCYYACPVTRITGLCGSQSDIVAIPTKNPSSFFLRLEGRQPRENLSAVIRVVLSCPVVSTSSGSYCSCRPLSQFRILGWSPSAVFRCFMFLPSLLRVVVVSLVLLLASSQALAVTLL